MQLDNPLVCTLLDLLSSLIPLNAGHSVHFCVATIFTMSVVSAPGKVLIVGGYLVLDAENAGHVLAASARFHSYAAWTAAPADTPAHVIHVKVISVQFGSETSFTVDVSGPLARPAAWCVPNSLAGSGDVPSHRRHRHAAPY